MMLPRSPSTALLVGLGAGAAGGYLLFGRPGGQHTHRGRRRRPLAGPSGEGAPGAAAAADHPALAHGTPPADLVRAFSGYVVGYDARARGPRWVAERLTHDGSRGGADRGVAIFHEDGGLDPRFRATNADFSGSGYDRGHMAPAADFKGDQAAMSETFALTNIAPQVGPGFNRDYWARFERFVKTLARPDGPPVWVITGPLFLPRPIEGSGSGGGGGGGGGGGRAWAGGGGGGGPGPPAPPRWEVRHPVLGDPPRMVSVPTHFYKVVLTGGPPPPPHPAKGGGGGGGDAGSPGGPASPTADHPALVAAFAFPNAPIDPAYPLTAFCVPLSALEDVAGLRFFPRVLGPGGAVGDDGGATLARLDGDALRWQAAGRAARAARARGGGVEGGGGGGGGPAGLLLSWPRRVAGLLTGGGGGGGGGDATPSPSSPSSTSAPPLTPPPPPGAQGPPDIPAGAPLPDAPRGRGRPPADAPAPPTATSGPPPPPPGRLAALFRGGAGGGGPDSRVRHVCDAVACVLPAEDWYKSSATAAAGRGGGGGGGDSDTSSSSAAATHGRRRQRRRRHGGVAGSVDGGDRPDGGWWWEQSEDEGGE